jgi:hypothetical protein
MLLYHFTLPARLYPTLVVLGEHKVEPPELLPRAEQMDVSCVWLTTEGTSSLINDAGRPSSLRVAVRVPDTDRKLVSFRKWLRRERIDPEALVGNGTPEKFLKRAVREWFLYLGTIPRERVLDIQMLPGQPWWLTDDADQTSNSKRLH